MQGDLAAGGNLGGLFAGAGESWAFVGSVDSVYLPRLSPSKMLMTGKNKFSRESNLNKPTKWTKPTNAAFKLLS